MREALWRAWHSPRTGPVLLVLIGLPLLLLGVIVAVFPVVAVVELGRFALGGGAAPFAGTPAWFLAAMILAWGGLIALGLQALRIAQANRGLRMQLPVRLRGSAGSALGLAKRLHAAMAAPDLESPPPIREDYGAGFWLSRGRDRFWLAVSEAGEGEVVLSLAYDPGPDLRLRLSHRADRAMFARLEQRLRQAVAADPLRGPPS